MADEPDRQGRRGVCGIAGFLAPPGERAERGLIERMTATLRHRGPDALGYHVEGLTRGT